MSNFYLKLEAMGGADIENCSKDAVTIADKLGVAVLFDFNGVQCMACPGDNAQMLFDAAMVHISRPTKPSFKAIATGH